MMNKRTRTASRMIAVGMAMTSGTAGAQTSAPGAYYAPPAWSQTLPASTRFIVLSNFNNEAVLDRETGLVWERTPFLFNVGWVYAFDYCTDLAVAGRMGWRLPTLTELQTLIDRTQSPAVPAGHPFVGLHTAREENPTDILHKGYWTATWMRHYPDYVWAVYLEGGTRAPIYAADASFVWCVRGPSSNPE